MITATMKYFFESKNIHNPTSPTILNSLKFGHIEITIYRIMQWDESNDPRFCEDKTANCASGNDKRRNTIKGRQFLSGNTVLLQSFAYQSINTDFYQCCNIGDEFSSSMVSSVKM